MSKCVSGSPRRYGNTPFYISGRTRRHKNIVGDIVGTSRRNIKHKEWNEGDVTAEEVKYDKVKPYLNRQVVKMLGI